ncbi:MAG: xanthine dehydrogenase family protein subunit M [Acidimicrobiia bacterium]
MKPAPFTYHAPATVADVAALLAQHGDDAKALAGGQSLIPMLSLRLARFEHLVDLNRVAELQGITRNNGTVSIGAVTRQAEVGRSSDIAEAVPLLAKATPLIGHFQIRNRGTLGGSIAHADPASEYPAVAIALRANMVAAGPTGRRTISADDFFTGTWSTSLADDEILAEVQYATKTARSGYAIEEIARRHGDFALAGIAAAVEVDEAGKVTKAGIGMFGLGPKTLRAASAEAALLAGTTDLTEVGRIAMADDADPGDDVHASGAYRRRIGAHLVTKALTAALQEARNG